MRPTKLIKLLIPDDWNEYLNHSSAVKWLAVVLLVAIGALFLLTAVDGFWTKRLEGKNGRVLEGTSALLLSLVYTIVGAVLMAAGIAIPWRS
jgi:hypothetical protein